MYSTLIRWLFISLLFLLPYFVFGQLQQKGRIEIPIASEDDAYSVASVGEQGLVLYRWLGNINNQSIELIYSDTSFLTSWCGVLPIPKKLVLANYAFTEGSFYLIFYDPGFSDRNFCLFEINLREQSFTQYTVRNSIPFIPATVKATSYGFLAGGYFINIPVVLYFDFKSQQSKILPGLFNEQGDLTQIKINPDETFDVLISAKNFQKQQTIWVKNYGPDGELLRNTMLNSELSKNLIFGRTLQTDNNTQIIAGVYGDRNSEYSRGLFIARIQNDGIQEIEYYSFTDLENFFKYMKAKRERRVSERIQRKKIKGKKLRFQYRFLVHEFVQDKNQFILLGEAFSPQYKYIESGYAFRSATIFDGYRYTHAVVLGVDATGKLLWDNSFEINDVKTFSLEQFVKMDASQENIALLYLFNHQIRTKIIKEDEVLEGKTFSEIETSFSTKNAGTESTFSKLDYWYKNYFLAYGTQRVTPTESRKKQQTIFFINKINYK